MINSYIITRGYKIWQSRYRLWQGIQNVAAPLPYFVSPHSLWQPPLPYFVSPHTLWGIHYLALHRLPENGPKSLRNRVQTGKAGNQKNIKYSVNQ